MKKDARPVRLVFWVRLFFWVGLVFWAGDLVGGLAILVAGWYWPGHSGDDHNMKSEKGTKAAEGVRFSGGDAAPVVDELTVEAPPSFEPLLDPSPESPLEEPAAASSQAKPRPNCSTLSSPLSR